VEHEAVLATDRVVLVKGRDDQKEAGKTCLLVQSVEEFSPSQEELERAAAKKRAAERTAEAHGRPLCLRLAAADLCESTIEELRQAIEECPGSAEVVIELATSAGTRRLRLGEAFRVRHTPTLRAELEQALAGALERAAPLASAAAGA
jgi:hypothetical protein